jgi:hypothetical protein
MKLRPPGRAAFLHHRNPRIDLASHLMHLVSRHVQIRIFAPVLNGVAHGVQTKTALPFARIVGNDICCVCVVLMEHLKFLSPNF